MEYKMIVLQVKMFQQDISKGSKIHSRNYVRQDKQHNKPNLRVSKNHWDKLQENLQLRSKNDLLHIQYTPLLLLQRNFQSDKQQGLRRHQMKS